MSDRIGQPQHETLVMYGQPSDARPLSWEWVNDELETAGTYWVVTAARGYPHPRPVWGAWQDGSLYLSIGSPAIRRALTTEQPVTVHLDSGTDVVIVEGNVIGLRDDDAVIRLYDTKYDYSYSVTEYGPLTEVRAATVLAWRAAGPAGRDGFQQTGRWRLGHPATG